MAVVCVVSLIKYVCVRVRHCGADWEDCGSCRQTTTIRTAPVTWLHTNVLVWRMPALSSASSLISLPVFQFLPVPCSQSTLTLLLTWWGSDMAQSCSWYNPPTTSAMVKKKKKKISHTGYKEGKTSCTGAQELFKFYRQILYNHCCSQ